MHSTSSTETPPTTSELIRMCTCDLIFDMRKANLPTPMLCRWGQAYLTKEFFHMLGSRMGDRVLLVTAEDAGQLVAGALNLIGGDTLYGRNWGCSPSVYYPNLHFETCYYQVLPLQLRGHALVLSS